MKIKQVLRNDFNSKIRPLFIDSKCSRCFCEESLELHHDEEHFNSLFYKAHEMLGIKVKEYKVDYEDDNLNTLRVLMLGLQSNIKYLTLCKKCHIGTHKEINKKEKDSHSELNKSDMDVKVLSLTNEDIRKVKVEELTDSGIIKISNRFRKFVKDKVINSEISFEELGLLSFIIKEYVTHTDNILRIDNNFASKSDIVDSLHSKTMDRDRSSKKHYERLIRNLEKSGCLNSLNNPYNARSKIFYVDKSIYNHKDRKVMSLIL